MAVWREIREKRLDLTDYVVHLTRADPESGADGLTVLQQILRDGYIRPTFAPMTSVWREEKQNTVKGPHPAVCLTEQPLWAILLSLQAHPGRYSGYGIAYPKAALFERGGRPVIYGSTNLLGRRIEPEEPGYEEGKQIYAGGLPADSQFLWCLYEPPGQQWKSSHVDFTWEREWRIKPRDGKLGVILKSETYKYRKRVVLVERDEDVVAVERCLDQLTADGVDWARFLRCRIISLETCRQKLDQGHSEYGRVETWPWGDET